MNIGMPLRPSATVPVPFATDHRRAAERAAINPGGTALACPTLPLVSGGSRIGAWTFRLLRVNRPAALPASTTARCGSASPSATRSGRSPARWRTTPAAGWSKTPSGSAGWWPRSGLCCSSSGCRSISDGRESQKSHEARQFGQWLAEVTGVPVEFFDERFTSREAEQHAAGAPS